MVNVGLLILRLGVGLILAAHGAQKLFAWFGGSGIGGFAGGLQKMGLRPPRFWAVMAGLAEFGGGLLVATGFLNPLGSFAVIAAMSVAILVVHLPKGFFNSKGGLEFPLSLAIAALALSVTGPGAYSLDGLLRLSLPEPLTWLVAAIGTVAGVALALNSGRLPVFKRRSELG